MKSELSWSFSFGDMAKKPGFSKRPDLPHFPPYSRSSETTEPNELKFRVELDFNHMVAQKKVQVIQTKSP